MMMIKNLAKLILHNMNKDYGQQKTLSAEMNINVIEDGR